MGFEGRGFGLCRGVLEWEVCCKSLQLSRPTLYSGLVISFHSFLVIDSAGAEYLSVLNMVV